MTEVQATNIATFLRALPSDIAANIQSCIDAWVAGRSAYGFPHPLSVISNHQSLNQRQPFLTAQQSLDLSILKMHIKEAAI